MPVWPSSPMVLSYRDACSCTATVAAGISSYLSRPIDSRHLQDGCRAKGTLVVDVADKGVQDDAPSTPVSQDQLRSWPVAANEATAPIGWTDVMQHCVPSGRIVKPVRPLTDRPAGSTVIPRILAAVIALTDMAIASSASTFSSIVWVTVSGW